ncbi:MAG TPA: hypothetical protein VJX71_06840 [Methylomirabilota bacterium]|nr:hypothetical protein [Methylomirabilota bacterium]
MPELLGALDAFVQEHRGCGELRGDADPITREGCRVWASCSCGATLDRWVSPRDAETDLLRSALLAWEN